MGGWESVCQVGMLKKFFVEDYTICNFIKICAIIDNNINLRSVQTNERDVRIILYT